MIDISLPITVDLPVWPGSPRFELTQVSGLDQDGCNETMFTIGSHTGTHIDAPKHFIAEGSAVETLPLNVLVGKSYVAECLGYKSISASVLENLALPTGIERLLLKTNNSELWKSGHNQFVEDFAALTLDGAEWLVTKGVKLVGIDYLSIQKFHDSNAIHRVLLEAGIVVLEAVCLVDVSQGFYELICLPLKVVGAEGAPVRAILREPSKR